MRKGDSPHGFTRQILTVQSATDSKAVQQPPSADSGTSCKIRNPRAIKISSRPIASDQKIFGEMNREISDLSETQHLRR